MNAAAEAGFGEVDQDLEEDFTAFLRPKDPKSSGAKPPGADKPKGGKPAKKAPAPRRRPAQRAQEPVEASSGPGGGQAAAAEPQERPESRTRPRRGRPPSTTGDSPHLVLWTPVSIRSRMQRVRNETGKKYADQVLDALEATVDELPELIAATTRAKTVKGPLFERVVVEDKPEVVNKQLTIPGLTASHIAVIDDLVTSTGAGSRSKLVNTALDHTLPPG